MTWEVMVTKESGGAYTYSRESLILTIDAEVVTEVEDRVIVADGMRIAFSHGVEIDGIWKAD